MTELSRALTTGYECLAAWSDLLDRINVFPVADSDTGTNLRISLAPLRDLTDGGGNGPLADLLSRCATGNSGNIAAAFFREFGVAEEPADLPTKAASGRDKAWQAVAKPRLGTMLSVFDALAAQLDDFGRADFYHALHDTLRETVLGGIRLLPDVQRAGVVDAGALGMFIFLDGFFQQLGGKQEVSVDVPALFPGKLRIARGFQVTGSNQYCVDAVIATKDASAEALRQISGLGESVVLIPDADRLKIHLHTPEPGLLRTRLASYGDIVDWSDEAIRETSAVEAPGADRERAFHLLSDAAGSLPRALADRHGISLLDSYIVTDGQSRPESLCYPKHVYALMRAGKKVTTAQASNFERHLHYRRCCQEMGRTLYLCVGSSFTGNYATVMAWKEAHDPDNLLEVLDTGAASGRLGLLVLLTARFAETAGNPGEVVDFARRRIADCEEYVFIDELKYLVAGGRVSRTSGFFGHLLHLKPVISPTGSGVRKVGVVRNRPGQLAFALQRLSERFDSGARPVVMLQYSDNEAWVRETVEREIAVLLPEAELMVVPLSLTSGVHMGPGTWAVAFSADRRDHEFR